MEDFKDLLDNSDNEGGAHDEASASKLLSSISDLYHDGSGNGGGGSSSHNSSAGGYKRQSESLPLRDSNVQSGSKLVLEDIIPTISDAALRKSSKQQQQQQPKEKSKKKETDGSNSSSSSSGKVKQKSSKGTLGKLDAPVSKIRQDKVNRQQAFEGSKEALAKWMPTVKRMRDAEHLSFPLAGQPSPIVAPPHAKKLKHMNNNNNNDSGSNKNNNDGNYETDEVSRNLKDINKIALSMEKDEMGDEEKRSHIARLRLARELMFREEVKAKRQKKIKSKTYRRIKKKEREQSKMYVEMLAREMEGAADTGDLEEEDEAYALERENERDGAINVSDLQNGDVPRLWRAKDAGIVGNKDLSNLNITGSDEEEDVESDNNSEPQDEVNTSFKSIAEYQEQENREEQEPEITVPEAVRPRLFQDGFGTSSLQTNGSMTTATSSSLSLPSKDKDARDKKRKKSPPPRERKQRKNKKTKGNSEDEDEDGHISLQSGTGDKPVSNPWLARSAGRNDEDQPEPDEIAGAVAFETSKASTSKPLLVNKDADAARRAEQADLVQRAFAGDDVVADFMQSDSEDDAAGKASLAKDDGLPGWGTWTGLESKRRETIRNAKSQKQNAKKNNGAANAGVTKKQKKKNMEKVKVNTKVNKKQTKYSATSLPHPFESKQQYERSLRVPIGPEWATKEIFRKSTTPRVLVKHSSVVHAISHPIS